MATIISSSTTFLRAKTSMTNLSNFYCLLIAHGQAIEPNKDLVGIPKTWSESLQTGSFTRVQSSNQAISPATILTVLTDSKQAVQISGVIAADYRRVLHLLNGDGSVLLLTPVSERIFQGAFK